MKLFLAILLTTVADRPSTPEEDLDVINRPAAGMVGVGTERGEFGHISEASSSDSETTNVFASFIPPHSPISSTSATTPRETTRGADSEPDTSPELTRMRLVGAAVYRLTRKRIIDGVIADLRVLESFLISLSISPSVASGGGGGESRGNAQEVLGTSSASTRMTSSEVLERVLQNKAATTTTRTKFASYLQELVDISA